MKLGVIGCGNMATAIISGAVNKSFLKGSDIYLYDIFGDKAKTLADKYSAAFCASIDEMVINSDIILIAVKPKDIEGLLIENKGKISDKLLVSVCAGVSIDYIINAVNMECAVARVMPNTPVSVGKGVAGVSFNAYVNDDQKNFVLDLFSSVGLAFELPENLIDTVTGLAGSGPAFVFMAIEAMADAGVLEGLPRQAALEIAAQTFAGAAELVSKSKEHPASLKDKVCSPGGTTIEGVFSLESTGFRSSIIKAVRSAVLKAKNMK